MRPTLDSPPMTEAAAQRAEGWHKDTVDQVRQAIAAHDVVVVGMAWNQAVKRARRALEAASVPHHYLELGNYLGTWRERLAVKLWSGWPTYPQVFVKGTLVGGADQTEAALADGSLKALLDKP